MYDDFSSWTNSSILAVPTGSIAEAGLVHEDELGLGGDRPGDAEPLLLAARQGETGLLQLVFDLFPESAALEGVLDALGQLRVRQLEVHAQPVGDVVEHRHRERTRLLEDHARRAAAGSSRSVPEARMFSPSSTTSPVAFWSR